MVTEPDVPVQENDELWMNYLNLAHLVDQRVIEDWSKIVDVILVYVGGRFSILSKNLIALLDRTFHWCLVGILH